MNIGLPLSSFKNSIFALDKDIYAGGEVLILKIIWERLCLLNTVIAISSHYTKTLGI